MRERWGGKVLPHWHRCNLNLEPPVYGKSNLSSILLSWRLLCGLLSNTDDPSPVFLWLCCQGPPPRCWHLLLCVALQGVILAMSISRWPTVASSRGPLSGWWEAFNFCLANFYIVSCNGSLYSVVQSSATGKASFLRNFQEKGWLAAAPSLRLENTVSSLTPLLMFLLFSLMWCREAPSPATKVLFTEL